MTHKLDPDEYLESVDGWLVTPCEKHGFHAVHPVMPEHIGAGKTPALAVHDADAQCLAKAKEMLADAIRDKLYPPAILEVLKRVVKEHEQEHAKGPKESVIINAASNPELN